MSHPEGRGGGRSCVLWARSPTLAVRGNLDKNTYVGVRQEFKALLQDLHIVILTP